MNQSVKEHYQSDESWCFRKCQLFPVTLVVKGLKCVTLGTCTISIGKKKQRGLPISDSTVDKTKQRKWSADGVSVVIYWKQISPCFIAGYVS